MFQFTFRETALVNDALFETLTESLEEYREHLVAVRAAGGYSAPEGTINLPYDDELAQTAYSVSDTLKNDALRYIIVVGIGGSNLGTKAVYDALGGHFDSIRKPHGPQIVFADTTDPILLSSLENLIAGCSQPEEFALLLISKSGGTTETVFNAEYLLSVARTTFGDAVLNRIVVISQPHSKLWNSAEEQGYLLLENPEQVGGRYSVLSPVGLMPLALAGIDVESFRQGARDMCEVSELDSDDNVARASATLMFANHQNGSRIHDTFVFAPQLESFGKWYRQLLGESIGKEYTQEGDRVFAGITPTVSVGSTDLHSVGQLYLGGPNDKFTTFIWVECDSDISTPEKRVFANLVPELARKSASDVMSAILEGTKIAYKKGGRPYAEITLPSISAYSLGALMQMKMIEIMYLANLFKVNAFDQPNVENYKVETKKILKE